MDVAFFQYAPHWIKEFAKRKQISNIEAYSWARHYDAPRHVPWNPSFNNLRSRVPEMEAAMSGMSTKEPRIFHVKGHDLVDCGWELAGAQLVQEFVIILA